MLQHGQWLNDHKAPNLKRILLYIQGQEIIIPHQKQVKKILDGKLENQIEIKAIHQMYQVQANIIQTWGNQVPKQRQPLNQKPFLMIRINQAQETITLMITQYQKHILDTQWGLSTVRKKTTIHNQVQALTTWVKIGTSTRGFGKQKQHIPGPGTYNFNQRPTSAGPQYSIGTGKKQSFGKTDFIPGPGQYDCQSYLQQTKGVTIGHKYQKNIASLSNIPGPGQYQSSQKRPMSGAKIGKAQRNLVLDSYGPGPGAYDQTYNAKKGSIKIGNGLRQNAQKNFTPGPGSYDMQSIIKGGVTISGMKNKKNIQITPGPGAYDPVSEGPQTRPCSAKIGKSNRSKFDNSLTPGPGAYNLYNFGGDNWKFAYSKQNRSKDIGSNDPGPGQYDIPPTVPSAPYYDTAFSKLSKSGYSKV